MDFPIPSRLRSIVDQIDGWLDLRCPERALELVDPVLADHEARACGLSQRIRAHARLGEFESALRDLAELRSLHPHDDWIDLTEAWCRRRTNDLEGAIRCAEQLIGRNSQHDTAYFNLACYLALANQQDRAIDALSMACGLNPDCRAFALDEPDLDGLRTDARFRLLVRPRSS